MTFEEWLQGRLVAHGHALEVDGVIGGATRTREDVEEASDGEPYAVYRSS